MSGKTEIFPLIKFQVILLTFLSIGAAGITQDRNTVLSLLAGGCICWIPSWVLYQCLFGGKVPKSPAKALKAFYWGECGKFFLTFVGFSAVFLWQNVNPKAVLLGFISVQSVFWLQPFMQGLFLKRKVGYE
jgi:ATP synthase protein I